MRRSRRWISAYDIVVQHAANRVALLLGPLEQPIASEQALLFTRNRGKQQRSSITGVSIRGSLAQEARGFHADGHSRSVIVRAGSIRLGIHHVRGAGIVVTRDNENGLRELWIGSRKHSVNIFERHGLA